MNQRSEYYPAPLADDDMLSLAEIVDIFARGKRWLVGTTLVFFAAALAYLFLVQPVYRSSALIKIETNQSSLVLDLLGTRDATTDMPDFSGVVEEMRSLGFVRNLIEMDAAKEDLVGIDSQAVKELRGRIAITEKGKGSGLIEIAVTGENPDANSQVLHDLINLYRNYLGQEVSRSISGTLILLTDRQTKVKKQIELLRAEESTLMTKKLELDSLQASYIDLNQKIIYLNVALELANNGVTVVSQPVAEDRPVNPKYALVMVLATMLGAMAGVVLVLLREMSRKGLRTAEEVEKKAGLSVLDSIGRGDIEGLRVLRTDVLHRLSQSDNNRVMVCGPCDGVGKRYIVTHLARIMAEGGKKVLLVDADLRDGDLSTAFADAHGGVSLVACLQQSQEFLPAVVNDRLHLLAGLQYPDMPSELLMGQRFEQLLDQVSKEYDIILLHVPPVLSATDAAVVGAHCANTVMVIRAEQTTVKEIKAAERRLQQAGVTGICCVFNEAPA